MVKNMNAEFHYPAVQVLATQNDLKKAMETAIFQIPWFLEAVPGSASENRRYVYSILEQGVKDVSHTKRHVGEALTALAERNWWSSPVSIQEGTITGCNLWSSRFFAIKVEAAAKDTLEPSEEKLSTLVDK